MAQSWTSVTVGAVISVWRSALQSTLDTVRSRWSGASDPTDNVAYQENVNTTTKMVRMRNAANSAHNDAYPVGYNVSRADNAILIGTLSATGDYHFPPCDQPINVVSVDLISDATTAHTSGNEFTFQLRNMTAGNNLFSAAPGTFTTVGGVGGGNLTADTARTLTPNQNSTGIAARSVLELQITKTGAPANITRLTAIMHVERQGI